MAGDEAVKRTARMTVATVVQVAVVGLESKGRVVMEQRVHPVRVMTVVTAWILPALAGLVPAVVVMEALGMETMQTVEQVAPVAVVGAGSEQIILILV